MSSIPDFDNFFFFFYLKLKISNLEIQISNPKSQALNLSSSLGFGSGFRVTKKPKIENFIEMLLNNQKITMNDVVERVDKIIA